jgi:hypothetical protein
MRVLAMVAACVIAIAAAGAFAAEADDLAAVQKALGPSLAKVSFYLKYDDGDSPGGRTASSWQFMRASSRGGYSVDEQAPLTSAGFLVGDTIVLTQDPTANGVEDRFIDRIEVEIAGVKCPAVMDTFALRNEGLFLRLAKPVKGSAVVKFDAKARGPYRAVTFRPKQDAQWAVDAAPVTEGIDHAGATYAKSPVPALVVGARNAVVGAALSERLDSDGAWKGSPLSWPRLPARDFETAAAGIRDAAKAGLLQVTINFRRKQSARWSESASYADRQAPTEMQAAGMLLGGGKVLVLAELSRRDTARIESMTLALGAKTVPLSVQGALVRYGALLAGYEGELDGAAALPRSGADLSGKVGELLAADTLSYANDARDERTKRERVDAIREGFLGLRWPDIQTSSADTFVFTLDGKLVAVPMTARRALEMEEYYYQSQYSGQSVLVMPVSRLDEILSDESAVDASQKPLPEDDEKRIVWLGVELQFLSPELARAKNASLLTKGGQTGVLIAHVYKDSPAAKAGVEAGDVLLRFAVAGQVKPAEVKAREERESDFPWAQLDQVPEMYYDQMPRAWPSQDNSLTRFLTEVGAGRTVKAVFVRDGQPREVEFALEFGPPDFNAAPSYEDKAAGLTVKDMTYEVLQYFKMKEADPGVVIAEIKKGSKASVAGLKPCEIITAVDSKPVKNVTEFKDALAAGGEVKLTVKRMFQTRVVKISLPAAAPKETQPQAAPAQAAVSTDSQLQPAGQPE